MIRLTGGVAGDLVAELVRLDQAYLTGPVMAELLHGARGKRETKELDAVFATIPILDVAREDWIKTGSILHTLRKKGLSVPLTDVLIASVALHNKMTVLTLDKHLNNSSMKGIVRYNVSQKIKNRKRFYYVCNNYGACSCG